MKHWLVRAASAALGCIAASAATFLSEPFPYPDASALTGTAGSPWTTLTGTAGELTVSGGTLSLSPAGSESVRAPLADGPHAATTLWTSFDLRASALPTATGAVFGQLIDASGSPRAGIVATTDGAASGSYRLRIGAAGLAPSATVLPLDLATGQTYQVVVRYLPLTGATTLWINPTHDEATIHTVTASDLSPVSSGINAFQWIQSADAGTLVVDNLKIASSFAEVTVPCAPQPSGLLGWWTGDATTANETGGTAASLANGATYTFGRVGQAFALDGSDDYVSIGSLNALDAATGITVGGWIRRDNVSGTVAGIISQWNTSPQVNNRFILYLGESGSSLRGSFAVQFSDGTVGSLASQNVIPANTWMHIAATWDAASGSLRIYKNGALDRSTTVGAGKVLAGTPDYTAKIGEWGVLRSSAYKFPGDIDEAFVANRALTATEIQDLVNASGSGWCRSGASGGGTGDSFVIEAEDFDHDNGQPVALTSVMPYLGGAASGLSAVNSIDFNRTSNSAEDDLYRIGENPNQPVVLNTAVESDRGPWEVNLSYRLSSLTGNEWFNYTRTIPAGRYRIIAAMSGSGARPLAARLSVVTSGNGTPAQNTVEIGQFSGTAGQGRSLNRFLTLQNDSGEVLVDLTGTVTLRISAQSGDIDYLQLIPEAAPRVAVSPQRSDVPLGGSVLLTAAATGTGPFTYQWRHNGVRIEAATNAVLELDSVNDADRGTYSCMVSDAGGHATGDSVVVTVVHPIAYNQTIAANLPNAGAGVLSNGEGEDLYELSGNAGEWIFFDEHSGNACALQWELIAPSGTRVFHHWLGGGCGNDGDTGLIQLPESGAFRLRIFTTDASDTGYGFRVTQVPPPLSFALNLGDAISDGSINGAPVAGAGNLEVPADADLYTFSATAGQRVYFDEQAGDGCFTQWSLTAPDGTQIFHHWLGFGCWNDGDPGTIALPLDGTYTLRVWTIDTRFGPYAFRLWPVATDAFDLVVGDVVAPGLIGGNAASGAGAIAAPGNTDTFRFTGATGDWIFFDEISGNGCTTVWTLTSPSGTQLFNHRFGHSCWDDGDAGRLQLPEEGTYTLTIQGVGESIPEYSFALLPSGPNEEFAVSLPLDLTANQLNSTETPGAGTLQHPGQQDVYTFTLTEPALLYAEDRGVAVCCIDWRLEDPDGGHVFWDRVDGYDPGRLGLSKLGTYRLRVFPVGSYREWSGPYSLKLHLLPPELPMNLAIDETVSDGFIGATATPGAGRIESAGINDIYQFTAEAGDALYLEDLGAAQCCIDWQIRDPNGNYFMCCDRLDGNDVGRYHVSVSGTYTLYVYPAGADPNWTGTYSFRLRRVVDDEFAIALDDLVSDGAVAGLLRPGAGRLEMPGSYDIYTFHAEAGQLLYLEDLGAETCCIDWQIRDPNNNYLMCCDRLDGNDLGRYQVGVTGEHTIYVYQAGAVPEWLGSYSFRVRVIPPDPTFPISYDQVVAADSIGGTTVEGAGTISHPGAYNLYTFHGTSGDVVYLEDMGAGQCCLDWQIRDPNGNYFMCCDRLDGSDPGRYTLGVTGTYTVYVYPAGASPDYVGNFSFQIRSIPSDGRFTVGIDEIVSADSIGGVATPGAGRLEYAGAYDYYTFTGTAGQTLYLDDLGADRCCMYWYILRPDGNYLMCCDYLDGYDVGRVDLPLDGTYTVVVYPGGSPDYSGAYSFRLRSPQPFITRQPVDLRVLVGASAELSIAADSPFGITGYQWFRGSLPVGSSSPSLPLSGVTPLDAGDYSVVIQNSFGAVTSRVAQVIVDSTQFQVASITPAASAPSPVTALVVTFSRPVDLTTLSAEDVVLTGPGGAVPVTGIVADDAQTVRLQLGSPLPDGDYSVAIGPNVNDVDGSPMLGGVMVPLYRTDFDERVGAEWNRGETATDATISAGGIPPRFAGFHGNNGLTLALANLPEHPRVRLVWDLFIIDSWDGNAHDDAFQITVGNSPSPLWRHNFSQFDFNADSFPGTPSVSGSNFSGNSWSDSIYRNLEVEFEHTSTDLSLRFAGANLQDIPDESWGIDNVRLYIPSAEDGRFLARFTVDSSGPRIVSSTPTGTVTTPVSTLTFTYSEPVDADGLSLDDISVSTPGGTVTLNQLVRETSNRYRLEISPARINTTYTLRIQPTARDAAGNLQDQDADATGGEVPEDVFTATFDVLVPPLITGNPSSRTILRNNPVTFSVSAQYTEPVTFQWFHDEDPIPDSNSPTLTLTDVTAADAGSYYCRVSDLGGSSPSAVAYLTVQENYGTLLPATLASRDVLPTVPGNGVAIELFNGIGGGPAPLPSDLVGRTPSGTTLSPFIDFPNPGSVISVGDSFISFFQQTTTPPEQVLGLAAANFILRHRFHLRVSSDLDLRPETEEIDIDLHVGSDDGFHLTVGGVFLGQAGDRGFSWSTMPVSFAQPGLYPVELLFAANAVGASGLEFAWTTTSSAAFALVPQGALYITPDLGDQLISFEELPTGSAVADQFLDKGIRFSTVSGTPGTTDRDPGRFVPVSPTRVFGTLPGSVESPSVVDLIFVSPNSTTPATTPFVSLFVIDAEQPGTRIQAYDAVGTEIFSQDLNAGPGTQTPVSITHPQIARLRLTLGAGEDRVAVDNVTFITPVALPDLEVSALSAPSIVTSSVPFEVTWQLRNRGTVPVSGAFQESVAISTSNLGTGASVLATLTFEGTLNPGDTLTRTQSITLPIETVGTRYFVVTTDSAETVLESGSPANNRAITGGINVILPPRPDLAITGMVSPATATPGQTVTLSWTLSNLGTAPAVGPFTEAVGWSNNAANSDDPLPAGFNLAATTPFAGTLQPGESVPRSITFTLPLNATAGTRFPVIVTDSTDAVFESDESNNGITGNNVEVDTVLSLALSAEGASESGGSITATLTRNRGLASAHPVTLLSSDPSEATVPASVVFPAGASTVQFLITPVLDGINDGNQTVTLSANATTTGTATATIQVIDVDQPRLTLAIDATTLTEGLSSPATLTRDPVAATDLIVSLSVTDSAQFLLPLTITIPAGQPSVSFAVISAEDTLIESDTVQTITASVSGFVSSSDSLTLVDNDTLTLELSIAPSTITEAGGTAAATGTITRSPVSAQPVFVELASNDPTAATVPATVVIAANTASATFPIAAVDDALVDGDQMTLISATATLGGRPPVAAAPQTVTVTDNDGPTLTLTLSTPVVAEGVTAAATGTIRRNTTTTVPLVVTLLSSDPSEATVPATVEIPVGSATATFPVDSIADATTDGSQMLTVTAMAPGFTEGTAGLTVTDLDLPDLVVASVTAPPSAQTEQIVSATYRIENRGNTPAVGPFLVRIYLSTDASPGGDSLAGQFNFTGTLPPGDFFELSPSFTVPRQVGNIYPVVEVDPIRTVPELSDANNFGIVAAPIVVESAYTAVASTDITQAPANTVVPIRGSAVRRSTGAPAGNVLVSVHVVVRGLRRTLGALTDSAGNFSLNFTPLPGEAGNYSIAAAHPGAGEPTTQDQFTLIGFKVNPVGPMAIIEGESAASSTIIENLSDVPLPGLAVELVSVPPGVTVTPTLGANELPGNGQVTLTYGVAVANGITTGGLVRFRISTASGLSEDIELPVIVNALRPVLVATPTSLETGMRRGTQTTVRFDIVNRGGRGTGPLRLLAPPLPWLTIAAGAELADLAPGATNPVTLVLTPAADLPLGPYAGSLFAQGEQGSVTIPFNFRALSDANGDLRVEAVDEFTYYAEGEPRVSGATVVVFDAIAGTEIARKTTGIDGIALFQNLREDYYRIEVSAADHGSYRGTHLVEAGKTTDALAFLPRQTVRYRWTVEPIQIEDRTQITIETVFETAVPTPVVTMEPTVIDLSTVVGDETQVDLTLTNHGLVTAKNSRFQLPTHPDWEFIPLITEVGDLPARSSLTVPMTIRRLAAGAGGGRSGTRRSAGVAAGGPCVVSGGLLWDLLCGPRLNTYTAPVTFNNAGTGCGGGGGGGWIGFGGWGGGFGGGSGPSSGGGPSFIFNPPDISPPELCSCDLLPKVCIEGGVSIDLGGQVERLMTAILSKLPAARLTDASMSISLSGELCTCCVDNRLSWEGNATGSASLSAQVEIGPGVAAELPFEAPAPWEDVAVSGRALAGIRLNLSGSVEATYTRECGGGEKFCVNGSALLTAFAGAEFEGNASAGMNLSVGGESGSISLAKVAFEGEVHGQIGIEGNLGAEFSWCNDSGGEISACGNLVARANIGGSLKGTLPNGSEVTREFGANGDRVLAGGECGSSGDSNLRRLARSTADIEGRITEPLPADLFPVPRNEIAAALNIDRPPDAVCARVKLKLEQEAVLTRDAFRAALEIENADPATLTDIGIELRFRNEAGDDVASLFGLRPPEISGITAIDGRGTLAGNTTGKSTWVLIPTRDAAGTTPIVYRIGGSLRYRHNGVLVTVPLADVPITVYPQPLLSLQYFHQRDVYSDDPFTPEVEPSIPYALGIFVRNSGAGEARNFRITSAQPQIVENERGLLIDFQLIGTEVAGESIQPSLTANFGSIAPGNIEVARWLFTSSLQGLFIDYSARFEHIDGLGNPRLSLIDEVSIHEMIRQVEAQGAFDDGKPDFLVNDVPDLNDLPDRLYLSNGSTNDVEVIALGSVDSPPSPSDLEVELTTSTVSGWVYIRVPEPSDGSLQLRRIVRSDGVELPLDKLWWTTDRTFIGMGLRPVLENILHVLDHNSTGRYTLHYADAPPVDGTAPSSQVSVLPAQSAADIAVSWTQSDDSSGVAGVDLFVSIDDGPFSLWLSDSRLSGSLYRGTVGRRYAFYSVARDVAGNHEDAPPLADAATFVAFQTRGPVLSSVPNQIVAEDGILEGISITVTDPDTPLDLVSVTAESSVGTVVSTAGITIEGNGSPRTLRIVPAANQNGVVQITLRATDGVESSTSVFTVTVEPRNDTPLARNDTAVGRPRQSLRIPVIQLLSNDTDVDGDSLTVSAVAATSEAGGTLRLAGAWVIYTPPTPSPATDRFTYTVSDPSGATATASVDITLDGNQGSILSVISIMPTPGGQIVIEFVGIPNRTYAVQRSPSLTSPVWTTLGSVVADRFGRFTFTDTTPPSGEAYYRTVDTTTP